MEPGQLKMGNVRVSPCLPFHGAKGLFETRLRHAERRSCEQSVACSLRRFQHAPARVVDVLTIGHVASRSSWDGTISAPSCHVPRIDGLPVDEFERAIDDPPCDFVVHLAQRLGLDRETAQATLCNWLLQCNRCTKPIFMAAGPRS